MPKKIPDLELKILDSASKLFASRGYAAVAMKDVAEAAGTSVGNLYNYYPAKKDLFLAVRKTWMQRFSDDFDSDSKDRSNPQLVLKSAVFRIMDMTECWTGLWEEFIESAKTELSKAELDTMRATMKADFREHILTRLDALIRQCANHRATKLLDESDTRLAVVLMTIIKHLPMMYPNEKEANKVFLTNYLNLLCNEE
jgi:AcrR family transcriptional regulator